MYNIDGRFMRLLHVPAPLGFLPFAMLLPQSMVMAFLASMGLLVASAVASWCVWPDIRSAALQARRWCTREFDGYW